MYTIPTILFLISTGVLLLILLGSKNNLIIPVILFVIYLLGITLSVRPMITIHQIHHINITKCIHKNNRNRVSLRNSEEKTHSKIIKKFDKKEIRKINNSINKDKIYNKYKKHPNIKNYIKLINKI